MKRWLEILTRYLRIIFGQWSFSLNWNKPQWVTKVSARIAQSKAGKKMHEWYQRSKNYVKANPRKSAKWAGGAVVSLTLLWTGYYFLEMYLDSLPKPDYVTVTVDGSRVTDPESKVVSEIRVRFSKSAAAMDQIGKPIVHIPKISPKIKGTWKWESDTVLVFTPEAEAFKTDWLVGEKYKIELNKKLFAPHLIFESYDYEFRTPRLTISAGSSEFYLDPTNNKIRKAVYVINANQPFDTENFKKRLQLTIRTTDEDKLNKGGKTLAPKVTFNSFATEAYVETEPLDMTGPDRVVHLKIEKGLASLRGGNPSEVDLKLTVAVPGRFSAFKVGTGKVIFARNEKYEPEQVLVIDTGVGVKSEDLAKSLKVLLLPLEQTFTDPNGKKHTKKSWSSPSEVTPKVLAETKPVEVEVLPTPTPYSASHSFRVKVPVDRFLYLQIAKGVKAQGEFELGNNVSQLLYSPNYTPEMMFMSEGALLTLSGDRKLPLLSRNVKQVRFEVARILPAQVNFLISKMFSNDSFKDPQFYGEIEDLISERFVEEQHIPVKNETETQYFSLDMKNFNHGQQGFFYVSARATQKGESSEPAFYSSESDSESDGESYADDRGEDEESGYRRDPPQGKDEDKRLILITDLGIIAKHTAAKNIHVFVQNLRTGLPVADARVDVIGHNGIAIVSQQTDALGRATFPSLDNYNREKKPLAIVAHSGGDASYLPYQMRQRELVYSRFDTGGEHDNSESDQLTAMLFSDRGLYRPGDTANIGMILRSKVKALDVANLPLVVSVTDPKGTKIKSEKMSIKLFSLQDFNFSTRETSPTGTYVIQLHVIKKINGHERQTLLATTEVQIEEFVPDKLKIITQLLPSKAKGWVPLDKITGSVSLKNLFGAAAENRVVKADLTISPVAPYSEKFKDYKFSNPNASGVKTVHEQLTESTTDEKGEATYDIDLSKYTGYFLVRLHTEGFEAEGGRGVETYTAATASQWKYLVGYKTDGSLNYIRRGSERSVDLIALDSNMEPTAANVKVTLNEIKYVSTLVKQRDNNYKYQSIKKDTPIKTEDKKITAKGMKVSLPTDNPGDFVYIVQNSEGDEINRIEFSIIGESNRTKSLDRNAELQIVLNKDDYQPGEEVELQIIAPYKGAGLITIERESIFAQKWFKTNSNTTVEKITIPETLSGNAYINVTFLRAIDSKEIYTSPLSFGVAPFSVSLEKQRTKITLKTPEKLKPGQTLEVKYSASRPTSIVLYGVDEGILQVANYKLPNPLAHFFKKRALQVETFQLLDLLLPEYSLLQSNSAPGGDSADAALGGNLNPFKAKTLKPVAFWSGVLDATEQEKTFKYVIPEYFNGNIKVMAVASSKSGLGASEEATISRGDFIITPTAPVFVTPSDEIQVGVSISNQSEDPKSSPSVKVTATTSEHLTVMGAAEQTIEIPVGREKGTSIRLKANNRLGVADFKIKADNGRESAVYSHQVSVRPAIPYMTTVTAGITDTFPLTIPVERELAAEKSNQQFSVSPLPLAIADGLLSYLNEFPHGCTEQIVSQTIPSLVLTGKLEVPGAVKKAQTAHDNLIYVLRGRQTSQGGFTLYDGDFSQKDHIPATIYAISYLVEAKDLNLATPTDMNDKILEFLKNPNLRTASNLNEARLFAQTIYLQARYGIVPSNDLNFLQQLLDKNLKGKWERDAIAMYLAGTYDLLKQEAKGWDLIKNLKLGEAQERDYEYYYDGLVRDTLLIKIVAKHFPDKLVGLLSTEAWKTLIKPITNKQYNTTSSAQLIMAFASISASADKVDFPGTLTLKEIVANGEKDLALPKALLSRVAVGLAAEKVELRGPGFTPLFYSFTQKGFDQKLPTVEIKKELEISRTFEGKDGKTISQVKMGDEVQVVLRWRTLTQAHIPYIVLVDLFPAGFELQRDSLKAPTLEFVDKREDRIVAYGSATKEMREVRYSLKATHKGKYTLPPIFGESMYDNDVQYRGISASIEVL